jgi:pyruvate/2-oxoglutarate dehydrogenase complex dihydrolipoamide acyltransferase (E2) component
MTQPADAVAREQVVCSLTPFFLEAAHGNDTDAHAAAEAMIAGFNPKSAEELMLAAQVVVYGLAGLDSLRRSAAEPDLPVSTHLRLRGNANAMQRAAHQCRRALDLRRKAGTTTNAAASSETPPPRTFTEADLREAIRTASAVIAEARAASQPQTTTNRATRRAAEKQARRTTVQIAA